MRVPFKRTSDRVRFYALTVVALAAALVVPPLAIHLTLNRQLLQVGERLVLDYARDVLRRADRTSSDLDRQLAELEAVRDRPPCSAETIALMRQLTLQSLDFALIGRIEGNVLQCSSYGEHLSGIDLGPVSFVGRYAVRREVRLPVAPDVAYATVQQSGWILFIPAAQSFDIPIPDHLSIATYSPVARAFRASRGSVRPDWMAAGRTGEEVTFIEDGRIVAVVESPRYATGVVAALPIAQVRPAGSSTEIVGIGIALVGGISIAAWILHLARQRLIISSWRLRRALRDDEIYLVYQPIVCLRTRRWVGAEALMRWRVSDGVEIPPDIFIPAAEETGLICQFTQRLLELVARDAPAIFARSDTFSLSLNLSSADMKSAATIPLLQRLVERAGVSPARFKVEITERSILDEESGREMISRIRALGIGVVVDDFGTGFSNLKYLTAFRFDLLKIDKAFVQGLGTEAVTSHVAFHIIDLAKSLHLELVAEGVEQDRQAAMLREAGVEMAQGWLFARPMPAAALVDGMAAA
ncbi:EAL domain-containing protein [Phreatobacter sp. AB_2022a]|uniref:EAL domain-containing protein n=1 Tax=Phreatobacter sp. AB_2022a TaxID=3003134 RepID=UPI0022875978|nr:EAL domain-containing protein [Phreatobacter sp. AB_2022a]MCZ0733142.1 EAL domain-containing protein [Phreatobacter sp. AB_2022a]